MRMFDGTWRLIDLDGAVTIGAAIGAKALSTAFMPPETTYLLDGEVVFRVQKEGVPYEPLTAHPTLDIWSFMAVLYRAIAHKPLLEADDRDNLRGKRELMALATWGPKALSEALADADAALVTDGVDAFERLVVCDLLGWGLQEKPENRPPSCKEVLAHAFFAGEKGGDEHKEGGDEGQGAEDQKGQETTEAKEPQRGLRMSRLHVAASLGEPLSAFDDPQTTADDLVSVQHHLGKTPLHLAVEAAHHAAVAAILAAAKARGVPSADLEQKDGLDDAPIHSLLKATEAAATSDVGGDSLNAFIRTLEVLGNVDSGEEKEEKEEKEEVEKGKAGPYQIDVNLVDANERTAYEIGIMSAEPRVRKLVTMFKMRSKFPPLQRIDITVEELHKVLVSDAVNPKVFKSVATQATKVCRFHGEWHGSVFAILGKGVDMNEVTKGIKNDDNPLSNGILKEKHSFLVVDKHGELPEQMLDDMNNIMVS